MQLLSVERESRSISEKNYFREFSFLDYFFSSSFFLLRVDDSVTSLTFPSFKDGSEDDIVVGEI